MKFGFISDIHLKNKRCNNIFSKQLLSGIDVLNQAFQTFSDNEVKTVFFLGDMFDKKYVIDIPILYLLSKMIVKWQEKFEHIYFLVGNHDIYKEPISSIEWLRIAGYPVINKTEVLNEFNRKFVYHPYSKNIDNDFIKQGGDFLLLHQLIKGFPLQTGITMELENMIDVSDLKYRYKWILSGHDHMSYREGNVISLGSPMKLTFGEEGERGVWIIENDDIKFIKLNYPEYITIIDGNVPKDDYNYYRVIAQEGQTIESRENVSVVVQKSVEILNRLNLSDNWDLSEVLNKYVELKKKDDVYLNFGKRFL